MSRCCLLAFPAFPKLMARFVLPYCYSLCFQWAESLEGFSLLTWSPLPSIATKSVINLAVQAQLFARVTGTGSYSHSLDHCGQSHLSGFEGLELVTESVWWKTHKPSALNCPDLGAFITTLTEKACQACHSCEVGGVWVYSAAWKPVFLKWSNKKCGIACQPSECGNLGFDAFVSLVVS